MEKGVREREKKTVSHSEQRKCPMQRPWRKRIGLMVQCSWSQRWEERGVEWRTWGYTCKAFDTQIIPRCFLGIDKYQWMALSLGTNAKSRFASRRVEKSWEIPELEMGIMATTQNYPWLRGGLIWRLSFPAPIHNLRRISLQVVYLGGEPWSMMRE